MRMVISLLMLSTLLMAATAHAEPTPKPETIDIEGHTGMLYAAPAPAPAPGKPWVLYAPTFAGLSLTQRKAYFDGFRQAGIAIAGLDLGEVRGAPSSTAEFGRFYDELVARGYSTKPILIGQSRGGLMMLGWAMRHPDKTGAFVGIYPCCNPRLGFDHGGRPTPMPVTRALATPAPNP
jgi:alpha-beta hydrolase superfamily lysophospholipase